MYSKEQQDKALAMHDECHSITEVMQSLGYPEIASGKQQHRDVCGNGDHDADVEGPAGEILPVADPDDLKNAFSCLLGNLFHELSSHPLRFVYHSIKADKSNKVSASIPAVKISV